MKRFIKGFTAFAAFMITAFWFSISAFALEEGEIRYSNELTSSPLRIFFAVLVAALFIVGEIAFEKIREKRVQKRNGEYKNREKD